MYLARLESNSSFPIELDVAEDEGDFDYFLGSKRGPKYWGQLREEWATCSNGQMQSPIDLSDLKVIVIPESGNLTRSYQLGNATLRNRGHDIAVRKPTPLQPSYTVSAQYTSQRCWVFLSLAMRQTTKLKIEEK